MSDSVKNKIVFKTKNSDGAEIELAVLRPTAEQERQGDLEYRKAFRYFLEKNLLLRSRLDAYLRSQNLWDDDKQKQLDDIDKLLVDGNKKLFEEGGLKLSAARKLCMDMRVARLRRVALLSEYHALDNNSVEGQAENVKFEYLVSVCTVYNDTGKPYFESLSDYQKRASEDAAYDAARNLAEITNGYQEDFEKSFPENQFLLKYKLCDNELRLINKDGQFIDSEGRLVDKDFNYITSDGKKCYKDGTLVEEKKEPAPFLDEDGQPIVL